LPLPPSDFAQIQSRLDSQVAAIRRDITATATATATDTDTATDTATATATDTGSGSGSGSGSGGVAVDVAALRDQAARQLAQFERLKVRVAVWLGGSGSVVI
jgi:hypothetical protein